MLRGHEEVAMIVHQDIGMQTAVRRRQRLPQALQVAQSIAIIQEAGQAVVATLHYVLRAVGPVEAGEAGHGWVHADRGGRATPGPTWPEPLPRAAKNNATRPVGK